MALLFAAPLAALLLSAPTAGCGGLVAAPPVAPQKSEDPRALLTHARGLLPAYTGEHRYSPTEIERGRVTEGVEVFRRALEAGADFDGPEQVQAWLELENAYVLLAEDDATRQRPETSAEWREKAIAACDAALAIDPESFHGHYARGVALFESADVEAASAALERAVELCDALLATEAEDGQAQRDAAALSRYHALPYLIRAQTEHGELESALELAQAYAERYSNAPWIEWDTALRRGDVLLDAGEYARAVEELEALLEHPERGDLYGGYPQIHERLGYLMPLVGRATEADAHLRDGIGRIGDFSDLGNQTILVYGWIYRLAFAQDDATHATAAAKLTQLADKGPMPGEFDAELARFVADGSAEAEAAWEAACDTEQARRLNAGEPQAGLASERAFFTGLMREQRGDLEGAQASYTASVDAAPREFVWEAAYARAALERLP